MIMQGQTINGYILQRRLGEGGMAEVWYAENEIGKPAAVKILNENLSRNTQIVERFHNEALVMVKLDHPNIRQVYGYGYLGDRHCIIMEYLEGDDLDALLRSGRHFTDEELRRWWNQTVDALNYTHAMGIVHRDIKPSNLFLDKRGNIKLLDFGIAKVKESMSMTRTGMTMGTLMYMSPEQVKDPKRVGVKSDVYSLAVAFVHLLTGKPIYDSDTSSEFDIQVSIVTKPVDLFAVPSAWQGFLEPYLEKDPDKRPALSHFEEVESLSPASTPAMEAKTVVGGMASAVAQPDNTLSSGATRVVTSSKEERNSSSSIRENETSTPSIEDKPKSKAGLWIGIGIAVIVALALLLLLIKPKGEEYDNKQSDRNEQYVTDSLAIAQAQQQIDEESQTQANAGVELKPTSKPTDKKTASLCDEPRYAALFQLPHGLKGYFDFEQAMACAKKQKKPLFVDFTAHGSTNNREMEANVWNDQHVLKLLREEYVIVALYVDDKTQLPENEWYTSTYDGKVKKTIGRKNADFQISEFGTNAQPYYCLLDNKGNLITKPYSYSLDKDKFVQFLQKGIDDFKKGVCYQKRQNSSASVTSNTSENSKKNKSMNGVIEPVRWTFEIKKRGNDEFDIVASAKIEPEWYLFSTTMPELGPLPTRFEIEPSEFFQAVGKARDLTNAPMYYDDVFDLEYKRFSGTASFAQTFKKLKEGSFPIKGEISGMAEKEGVVIPLMEYIDLVYK